MESPAPNQISLLVSRVSGGYSNRHLFPEGLTEVSAPLSSLLSPAGSSFSKSPCPVDVASPRSYQSASFGVDDKRGILKSGVGAGVPGQGCVVAVPAVVRLGKALLLLAVQRGHLAHGHGLWYRAHWRHGLHCGRNTGGSLKPATSLPSIHSPNKKASQGILHQQGALATPMAPWPRPPSHGHTFRLCGLLLPPSIIPQHVPKASTSPGASHSGWREGAEASTQLKQPQVPTPSLKRDSFRGGATEGSFISYISKLLRPEQGAHVCCT